MAGWNRAQGAEEKPPELGDDEFDDLLARNAEFVAAGSNPVGADEGN